MISNVEDFKKKDKEIFLELLKQRFNNNMQRHLSVQWKDVYFKLINDDNKLFSLYLMEATGGEPDVFSIDEESKQYTFIDSCTESPIGRRSLCYDIEALQSRKKNRPENDVISLCESMGVKLLSKTQYHKLLTFGDFDNKTSSWIKTPVEIRTLGGALFCDFRYNKVFVYHNGADSYYSSRGFRASIMI